MWDRPLYGSDVLKQELERTGQWHYGAAVQESVAAKAERIVRQEMERCRWDETTLAARRKGDATKVGIAQQIQRETTVNLAWIAQRLQMGTKTYLAHLLYWKRLHEK